MLRGLLRGTKQFLMIKLLKSGVYGFLTIVSILSYGVIFSYSTVLKHYNFSSYAADLGVFSQSFYTTLFDGKLFYYTIEQWLIPSGCFFAVHFSPILFLLLPVYAIYPSPETLLVAQSFLLAFAALPLYMLSTWLLKSKAAGFALVIAYLLYTPLQGANWFDFHPQAFIPILIFAVYYFAVKESWKLYFASILLVLMIEEHLVYIVFLLSLYQLLTEFLGHRASFSKNSETSSKPYDDKCSTLDKLRNALGIRSNFSSTSASVWVFIVCVLWVLLTKMVKGFYLVNPEFLDIYQAQAAFSVLGLKGDILYLPIYILLNPQNVFNALMFDFPTKFLYVLILFGPLLFLSFRSKLSLITLVVLGTMLLTNYKAYYTVGAQYPLYITPLVFIATIDSLASIHNGRHDGSKLNPPLRSVRRESNTSLKNLLENIVIVSLIFSVCTSPLSPIAYTFSQNNIFWYPAPTQFKQESYVEPLHKMIALIPSNASILTQNPIFPHVSSRINAYLVPFDIPSFQEPGKKGIIKNYVRQMISDSEYILLDSRAQDYWTTFLREEIPNSQFGLYALTYSFVLFKRDYAGIPIFVPDVNYEVFSAYRDLGMQNGAVVYDKSSESKYVALSRKGIDDGSFLYGPYICLPQGNFSVTFEVKVQDFERDPICSFDVAYDSGQSVRVERTLNGSELTCGAWMNVTLTFSLSFLVSDIEFRIFTSGLANIYADRVIVEKSV